LCLARGQPCTCGRRSTIAWFDQVPCHSPRGADHRNGPRISPPPSGASLGAINAADLIRRAIERPPAPFTETSRQLLRPIRARRTLSRLPPSSQKSRSPVTIPVSHRHHEIAYQGLPATATGDPSSAADPRHAIQPFSHSTRTLPRSRDGPDPAMEPRSRKCGTQTAQSGTTTPSPAALAQEIG